MTEISFRACRHEAGHAVMAILLGYDVQGISVSKSNPYTDIPALKRRMTAKDRALIALAGDTAEAVLDWHLRGTVGPLQVIRDLKGSDFYNFELAMNDDPGLNKLILANEAWDLLKRSKWALGVLARALEKRGSMTEREVYEALGLEPPRVKRQKKTPPPNKAQMARNLRAWAEKARAAGNTRAAEFFQHRAAVLEGRATPQVEYMTTSVHWKVK